MSYKFYSGLFVITAFLFQTCRAGPFLLIPFAAVWALLEGAVAGMVAAASATLTPMIASVGSFFGIGASGIWFGEVVINSALLFTRVGQVIGGMAAIGGVTGGGAFAGMQAGKNMDVAVSMKNAYASQQSLASVSASVLEESLRVASIATHTAQIVSDHRASADAQFRADQAFAKTGSYDGPKVFSWTSLPGERTKGQPKRDVTAGQVTEVFVTTNTAAASAKCSSTSTPRLPPRVKENKRTQQTSTPRKTASRARRSATRVARDAPKNTGPIMANHGKVKRVYPPPASDEITQKDINQCYDAIYDMVDAGKEVTIDVPAERSKFWSSNKE